MGLTSVGNYDPSSNPVYKISEADLSDYESLGITAGSYAINKNSSGQWELESVNATDADNIISLGNKKEISNDLNEITITSGDVISFSNKKDAFDALGLSSSGTLDKVLPADVYTITEEVATNNPDLGLSAGTSYALSRTAAGEWEMLPVNVTDLSNIFLTGDATISFTAKKTALTP